MKDDCYLCEEENVEVVEEPNNMTGRLMRVCLDCRGTLWAMRQWMVLRAMTLDRYLDFPP